MTMEKQRHTDPAPSNERNAGVRKGYAPKKKQCAYVCSRGPENEVAKEKGAKGGSCRVR
jgi:hypothetical protein